MVKSRAVALTADGGVVPGGVACRRCGAGPPYRCPVPEGDAISVMLSKDEWRVVQEALDVYHYETEHERPGGLRPSHRERRRLQRDERLRILAAVDREIGTATGLGPLFG